MDYDLFGLDRSGIDHYWVNDTLHFLIVDGSITSIAGLAVGEYGIEVRAYDPYGNVVYAIFCVTVVVLFLSYQSISSLSSLPSKKIAS